MSDRLNWNESGERFEGIVSIDELRANGIHIPEDKSSGVTSSGLEWARVGDASGIALSIPITKISVLVNKFGGDTAKKIMRFVGYVPLSITSLSNLEKVRQGKISKEQGLANLLTDTAYTAFAAALTSAVATVTGMIAVAAGIAAIVVASLETT